MKRALVLAGIGLLGLMVQGAAATLVPAQLVPDAGLLLVFGIALCLRSTLAGVAIAAFVGLATDVLSGSLLGQHVLMRMAVFGAARIAGSRLNLRGPLPRALCVLLLSLGQALGLWLLDAFFLPGTRLAGFATGALLAQALVNAALAPVAAEWLALLSARLGDDEAGRPMRIAPRSLTR